MSRNAIPSHWWTPAARALARWREANGEQGAAALAYYLLASLLPLLIILVTTASLFVDREVASRSVVQAVSRYTPLTDEQKRAGMAAMRSVLDGRGTINVAAFALLTLGALQFLRTLIRTTNRIWHSPAYSWWRLPLKSLGLLSITASVVLFGILLPAVTRLTREWLTTRLALPVWAFTLVFDLIPWLVLFYAFVMIYKLAPSRATTFADVWIGALAATGLIRIGGRLFDVYAANFAHFDLLYGTLGGLVGFLLWTLAVSCACVFGICLCAVRAEDGGNPGGLHEMPAA